MRKLFTLLLSITIFISVSNAQITYDSFSDILDEASAGGNENYDLLPDGQVGLPPFIIQSQLGGGVFNIQLISQTNVDAMVLLHNIAGMNFAKALDYGDTIGPNSGWANGPSGQATVFTLFHKTISPMLPSSAPIYGYDANSCFIAGVNDKYLGLTLGYLGSTKLYAWVRISISADGSEVTIKDWAYSSTGDTPIAAGDKGITSLEFASFSIGGGYSTITDTTINAIAPYGTDITDIASVFTVADANATIKIGTTDQVSGTTKNNFTNPVTYILDNGSETKNVVVTTTVATASAECDFTSFGIDADGGKLCAINTVARTITYSVIDNTYDKSDISPQYLVSSNATVTVGGTPDVSGSSYHCFNENVIYKVTAEDGNTSKDYTVAISGGANGICFSEITKTNNTKEINIYPNPSNGLVSIDMGSNINNAKVEIFDIVGKVIYTKEVTNQLTSIDLTNNKRGIYFVKITQNNKVKTHKLVLNN